MVAAREIPPVIRLHPWQRRAFDCTDRIVAMLWHRQAGKDFDAACISSDDALKSNQDWYIVSMTQRQADETFAKCKTIVRAFLEVLRMEGQETFSDREYVEYDKLLDHSFEFKARTIHLPGGGSITSLPGRNPDTLAGLTGNVIFTEFGLFPNGGYDHWRVIFPLVTRGYRILVISTPRGRNTKFFELCNNPEACTTFKQTIEDSVREGFVLRDHKGRPCSIETFKRQYGDEQGWKREYLCEFTGDLAALLTYAILLGAVDPDCAPRVMEITSDSGYDPAFLDAFAADCPGRPELGWDVARSFNLSVVWINGTRNGRRGLWGLVIMRDTTFALQRRVVTDLMRARPDAVGAGDATGMGASDNEALAATFGQRWEPVLFTAGSKSDMASEVRVAFDQGDQAIPPMDGATKWIGADLACVSVDAGKSNRPSIIADANPLLPGSHADVAMGLFLARRAAKIKPNTVRTWMPD